ncbi:MAG: UDP-N-acetylmuramate dehydrogenase [Candidatus Parcubacteria bacterium]|nr:UDP-N-acetylmuramate dehydrogenase [Candidatus Parcubacteria bacterium]
MDTSLMAIKILKNISLAPYTTFKIGGRAKYFFIAKTIEQLKEAIAWSKKNKIKYFILGGGSNLLFPDRGFSGLVIRLDITNYKLQASRLTVGASLPLSHLVQLVAKNNLTGLEWAVGIPGTVGGAIRGNAGAFGQSISQAIDRVIVLTSRSAIERWSAAKCRFAYRDSIFKSNQELIISGVELKLKRGRGALIKKQMKEFLQQRRHQPKQPSAGCVFKNPTITLRQRLNLIAQYPGLINKISPGGLIPAAWLIDQCGLRGEKSGRAQISREHANFIVNSGRAKARDVEKLIVLIKKMVYNKFNIKLREEIEIV